MPGAKQKVPILIAGQTERSKKKKRGKLLVSPPENLKNVFAFFTF
jgi:hypothetical protein